jgi:alpha-tubulin suppressor-like RCC1 family protein/uncharacterized protein YjdB
LPQMFPASKFIVHSPCASALHGYLPRSLPRLPMTLHRALAPLVAAAVLLACSGDGPTGGGGQKPSAPAKVTAASGNEQTATVGTKLSSPLVVKVTDASGKAVSGTTVTWGVTEGGGSLSSSSSTTDAQGQAQVEWTLGTQAGRNAATASVGSLPVVTFTARGTAGSAAKVEKLKGDGQLGTAGGTLSDSLSVKVTDAHGNGVSGATVTWAVTAGGGTLSPTTSTTDTAGIAKVQWTLGKSAGQNGVTGTVSGLTAATFNATGRAGVAARAEKVSGDTQSGAAGTALSNALVVKAMDANGNPVAGVSVTWQVTGGGGSISPTIATTDTAGLARGTWTLGTTAGANTATASAAGVSLGFAATGVPGAVASVEVVPNATTVQVGGTTDLRAVAKDAFGNVATGRSVTWSTSDASKATVSTSGVVTGVAAGSATITATVEGKTGTASITINPVPVASVTVSPSSATIQVGATQQLTATLKDANGTTLTGRTVSWSSSNTAVATVSSSGLVSGVAAGGPVTITAAVEGKSGTAQVTVSPAPSFVRLAAANFHTCGLLPNGAAYCWGANGEGQLGDGSTTFRFTPVAVAGGHSFVALAAGGFKDSHTCGIASSGVTYCWGSNDYGEIGDGSTTTRLVPTAVGGGRAFTALAAGGGHTCGLTANGAAYCWGLNQSGQLGDGSTTTRLTPVAVAGGHSFITLTAYAHNTCALKANGEAYCWGANYEGQIGNGSTAPSQSTPVAVAGGHSFAALAAGTDHTCGLLSNGAAYCWGSNQSGQLGDGSTTSHLTPGPVAGGRSFKVIWAGAAHTCGVTTNGAAYCWGFNQNGQLGNGSTSTSQPTPVAVTGGHSFTSVIAAGSHTCGLASKAPAYCWGDNSRGQLGDGSTVSRVIPVAVANP